MAITALKVWSAGEILTAADLVNEFANLYDSNQIGWPATVTRSMNGLEFVLDADSDSGITVDTDDRLDMRLQAVDCFRFNGSVASVGNGFDFIASADGTAPTITAQGTDTNIDINLVPKASGVVQINGVAHELTDDAVIAAWVFA